MRRQGLRIPIEHLKDMVERMFKNRTPYTPPADFDRCELDDIMREDEVKSIRAFIMAIRDLEGMIELEEMFGDVEAEPGPSLPFEF